jgi:hypothetical protein
VYFYSSSIIIMKIMHTICSYIYIVYKRQCFVPVPQKIYLTLCFCCESTPICGMQISVWHFPIYGSCVTRIYCRKHAWWCCPILRNAEEEGKQIERGVGEGRGPKICKKNCFTAKPLLLWIIYAKPIQVAERKKEKPMDIAK